MQLLVVQRVVGLLLIVFSLTMLPPAAVSLLYGDTDWTAFTAAFALTAAAGVAVWLPVRRVQRDLRTRDGFLIVALFWSVLGLFGSAPLLLADATPLSFTDAAFESVSGLTTTGSTVMTGLDELPHGILFYRQQLQWLGGMGIIVLAVAILPMLGVGGMQLYRAETPGPIKDAKLTPRITETAKALWYVYLGLTAACGIAYWLAGMTPFDAICHAFTTVATGGYSPHDASIGFFDEPAIKIVAITFMIIGGVNFSLHFMALRAASLGPYAGDPETRGYIALLSGLAVVTCGYLIYHGVMDSPLEAVLAGLFQVVSIGTTTGYTTADFHAWPGFLPVLLVFASFVGGCGGSTTGGMKVMRFVLLIKQGMREIVQLIHPSGQIPVKMGRRVVPHRVVEAVWGFFSAYVAVFVVAMLILMATGLDQVTAFSAVAATLNNLGPGLGEVAPNFSAINAPSKWVLVAAMVFGRLEIFTLLVLLTPAFWRR